MSKLSLTKDQFQVMIGAIAQVPHEIFLSPRARHAMALHRFQEQGSVVREFGGRVAEGVMPGTISHNRLQIDDGSFASLGRSNRLLNPISAVEAFYKSPSDKTVLSIGPRAEMELLHLIGLGFSAENIKAIDLISTSPWIDVGDMHALPYPDRSFDVVISSWVLAYSSTPQKAVDEMMRVAKSGALVAIGATHNPKADELEYKAPEEKILGSRFRRVSQYLDMIGPKLDRVYFQDEPAGDEQGAVILLASVRH